MTLSLYFCHQYSFFENYVTKVVGRALKRMVLVDNNRQAMACLQRYMDCKDTDMAGEESPETNVEFRCWA